MQVQQRIMSCLICQWLTIIRCLMLKVFKNKLPGRVAALSLITWWTHERFSLGDPFQSMIACIHNIKMIPTAMNTLSSSFMTIATAAITACLSSWFRVTFLTGFPGIRRKLEWQYVTYDTMPSLYIQLKGKLVPESSRS